MRGFLQFTHSFSSFPFFLSLSFNNHILRWSLLSPPHRWGMQRDLVTGPKSWLITELGLQVRSSDPRLLFSMHLIIQYKQTYLYRFRRCVFKWPSLPINSCDSALDSGTMTMWKWCLSILQLVQTLLLLFLPFLTELLNIRWMISAVAGFCEAGSSLSSQPSPGRVWSAHVTHLSTSLFSWPEECHRYLLPTSLCAGVQFSELMS